MDDAQPSGMTPVPALDVAERLRFLADNLDLPRRLRVVDIGARLLTGDTPYQALFDADLCDVIGFEPQEDEFQRLEASKGPRETYHNCALGNGRRAELHRFHHPRITSVFPG